MAPARASSIAEDSPLRMKHILKVLKKFNAGAHSVHDAVNAVNSRRLLWEASNGAGFPIKPIFRLSEERLFELLQALVRDDPGLPGLYLAPANGTLLHFAMSRRERRSDSGGPSPVSSRVLMLLCAPGVTRVSGEHSPRFGFVRYEGYPLHVAVESCGRYMGELIDRLLCLDPDVLMMPDRHGDLPVHLAISALPPPPASDALGSTPAARALEKCDDVGRDMAELLERFIQQFPESMLPSPIEPDLLRRGRVQFEALGLTYQAPQLRTPLLCACECYCVHTSLVQAVVAADPSALGLASGLLPFEIVGAELGPASELAKFLEEETLHLALAAAEYFAMGKGATTVHEEVDDEEEAVEDTVTAFHRHLRDTVSWFVAAPAPEEKATLLEAGGRQRRQRLLAPPPQPSAYATTRAIRALDNKMEFCQELFLPFTDGRAAAEFCQAVLGDAVLKLYRMNHQDRSDPTPTHQVQLLASVSDSLDCVYLQFREHGHRLLLLRLHA